MTCSLSHRLVFVPVIEVSCNQSTFTTLKEQLAPCQVHSAREATGSKTDYLFCHLVLIFLLSYVTTFLDFILGLLASLKSVKK